MSGDDSSTARTIRLIRAEGYAEAVAKLRAAQRIADQAFRANTAYYDPTYGIAADLLEAEATKETTDHA